MKHDGPHRSKFDKSALQSPSASGLDGRYELGQEAHRLVSLFDGARDDVGVSLRASAR
jgi:hypothetical protein